MSQNINIRRSKTIHGAKLLKGSAAGRKSQFILQSSTASTDFNVPAGTTYWIVLQGRFWPTDLTVADRSSLNLISPNDILASDETDVYVDVDQDVNHLMGVGGLSNAQLEVHIAKHWLHSPRTYTDSLGSNPYSNEAHYAFYNNDVSDHHIYFYATLKYIIFGDTNL